MPVMTTLVPAEISPTATVSPVPVQISEMRLSETGYTTHGEWSTDLAIRPAQWRPGDAVQVEAVLKISEAHLFGLRLAGKNVSGLVALITAERTFDAEGVFRQTNDERMSTLVTPNWLAIEGGVQGAATNRFGYDFRTPVDELTTILLKDLKKDGEWYQAIFKFKPQLPADLPPGIYRLRVDYGIMVNKNYFDLNGDAFAKRGFPKGRVCESHLYSAPIPASGKHVSGRMVDATKIQPRMPWVVLGIYNSNGYRGVVAEEDMPNFAISYRNLIQDDVILPRYDDAGKPLSYSLEPQFPTDIIEARSNIPWDFTKGQYSVQITGPDGKTTRLGEWPFVGNAGQWPTTKKPALTAWKPPAYGKYMLKTIGWIADRWGNRYEGGGTYTFWIARRMTMATATFQGMAYPVGTRYGRDIGFSPAVPAEVEVHAELYVNSDPKDVRKISYKGKASPAGIYGAAQGMLPFPLDAPGEYHAHIIATYTDRDGHLWVCSMRHAGVVYPDDSPIAAHGKKLSLPGKKLEDRGETQDEGWASKLVDLQHLVHINYPYRPGDVLLISSEFEGANKIEPVLTYEYKANPVSYDPKLQMIGATNVRMVTSNGYSPHLFPEYITERAYYYAGAPRPGFMSRFLVGENGVRAPYWALSPNSFGGQIGASNNGDMPGDIYRLIGGVVVRKSGMAPAYAGYIGSAFVMPKGVKNNRVIAPGSEDLLGSDGTHARFFLVGTRPGMVYESGTTFAMGMQVDPILPVSAKISLQYPDGRLVTTTGTGDSFGLLVGKDRWLMDIPGVYRYRVEANWEGHQGYVPGLPSDGGMLFVIEKERPVGAKELTINLPNESKFNPAGTLKITGTTSAQVVYYAMVIPGAVVAQGSLPVKDGRFEYVFDPVKVNQTAPTYDITNQSSGKSEIGDVVHLTFFSQEKGPDGNPFHSFQRIILRGNTVLNVK
jgi:hypothetical protein